MNLCDINTVKRILSKHGFTFSKALGQNFLIDPETEEFSYSAYNKEGYRLEVTY